MTTRLHIVPVNDRERLRRDAGLLASELRAIASGLPTSLNAGEADRFAAVVDELLAEWDDTAR